MGRPRTRYACTQCGGTSPRWAGRCSSCGEWNTLVEERTEPEDLSQPAPAGRAAPVVEVPLEAAARRRTGLPEVDRVLGGGLVPGSVTLVAGEPGVGKSTLLLQALVELSWGGSRTLYVSAEESAAQVRMRAERLGALSPDLWLLSESSLQHVLTAVDEVQPAVVVLDSIQTVASHELTSAAGTVAQVRECAHRLVATAKRSDVAFVLVGHVTKDGSIAGPRVLEHMVDTVLELSGDRYHALRLLRARKHRFGATDEVGVLEMREGGLRGVPDPSQLFLADRNADVAGSMVVPAVDGHRPFLVEVQALVAPSVPGQGRRSAEGMDRGRLDLLLAVLSQRAGVWLADRDVYAMAMGGCRIDDPGADLGTALAVASARLERPVPADLVALGEVGLGGEVRQVGHMDRRLAEARRLGFERALVPAGVPEPPIGMEVVRVRTVRSALRAAGLAVAV